MQKNITVEKFSYVWEISEAFKNVKSFDKLGYFAFSLHLLSQIEAKQVLHETRPLFQQKPYFENICNKNLKSKGTI